MSPTPTDRPGTARPSAVRPVASGAMEPCPFCGTTELADPDNPTSGLYPFVQAGMISYVRCLTCSADGPAVTWTNPTESEAIDRWNHRGTPEASGGDRAERMHRRAQAAESRAVAAEREVVVLSERIDLLDRAYSRTIKDFERTIADLTARLDTIRQTADPDA